MKPVYLLCWAIFLAGCDFQNITLSGTAREMDGGVISITDLFNKTLFSANITSGKFEIKQQPLSATGYYTFSIMSGSHPRDYEIYLEPGTYIIDVPQNESSYLNIKTDSKTQNKLSAYYNFEDSVMTTYRKERDMWNAKLNGQNTKSLSEAEINTILDKVNTYRNREHGMHIAAMDMFIKKYPQNDIVPHVMTNMNYGTDPYAYYTLYNKLSPAAKNTDEGKMVGEQLKHLVKQVDAQNNLNKTSTRYPSDKTH